MACSSFPDIWNWIQHLPPIDQWSTNSISISICSSSSSSSLSPRPSLQLSISKPPASTSLSFSIIANYNIPVTLWTSKPLKINPRYTKLFHDQESIHKLLTNFIKDVLGYSPIRTTSYLRLPKIDFIPNIKDIFNFTFLALAFIISIYEAPADIRSDCLNTLKDQFTCPWAREVSKVLMRILGSNTEEQWMRSMNLAITNWILELQASNHPLRAPCSLYSSATSTLGLWKIQLYCPVIAMDTVSSNSDGGPDQRLLFSLNYHQLEGVIQLNYKVVIQPQWIDVIVNIDNIRCDVIRLVNDGLMKERGAGVSEKHFPSRISLQLTPTMQTNVTSISVSKSSENPRKEIGIEKSIEGSFEPKPHLGLSVTAGETMTIRPWKFEQSVLGDSVKLNWFLHDSIDGREVVSSNPSKFALLKPRAWFRNRYSSVYRPFTRQGGIIFAGDEYGENVLWKVDKCAVGKVMEWEIRGWIWLTYWPNEHKTFYTETRRLEFRETLQLTLA